MSEAPAMPPKHGKWRSGTRRTWGSWWDSPVAGSWTPAQSDAAMRLIVLVDQAHDDPSLAKEIRLGEQRLGLSRAPDRRPGSGCPPMPPFEAGRGRRLEMARFYWENWHRPHRLRGTKEAREARWSAASEEKLAVLFQLWADGWEWRGSELAWELGLWNPNYKPNAERARQEMT